MAWTIRGNSRPDLGPVGEGGQAEDDGRDQRHLEGLEQVGGHAGAVADVVADVVGDGGRVAGVVLGDRLLDLADQVGPDVGGLGEDAPADPHEHGQQGGPEAEAEQHAGRVALVEEDHPGGAEQAQADHEHAGHPAGPEGDRHGLEQPALVGRGRDPHVGPHGQVHAGVAGQGREDGPDQEGDRAADPHRAGVGLQQQQEEEEQGDEHGQGAELPAQVGAAALLDGAGDLAHLVGALVGGQHLPDQDERDQQGEQADRHDGEQGQVLPGAELDVGARLLRQQPYWAHQTSSTPQRWGVGSSPGSGPRPWTVRAENVERGPRPGVVPGACPGNRPSREPARIGRIIATGRRTGQPVKRLPTPQVRGGGRSSQGVGAQPLGHAGAARSWSGCRRRPGSRS